MTITRENNAYIVPIQEEAFRIIRAQEERANEETIEIIRQIEAALNVLDRLNEPDSVALPLREPRLVRSDGVLRSAPLTIPGPFPRHRRLHQVQAGQSNLSPPRPRQL